MYKPPWEELDEDKLGAAKGVGAVAFISVWGALGYGYGPLVGLGLGWIPALLAGAGTIVAVLMLWEVFWAGAVLAIGWAVLQHFGYLVP